MSSTDHWCSMEDSRSFSVCLMYLIFCGLFSTLSTQLIYYTATTNLKLLSNKVAPLDNFGRVGEGRNLNVPPSFESRPAASLRKAGSNQHAEYISAGQQDGGFRTIPTPPPDNIDLSLIKTLIWCFYLDFQHNVRYIEGRVCWLRACFVGPRVTALTTPVWNFLDPPLHPSTPLHNIHHCHLPPRLEEPLQSFRQSQCCQNLSGYKSQSCVHSSRSGVSYITSRLMPLIHSKPRLLGKFPEVVPISSFLLYVTILNIMAE